MSFQHFRLGEMVMHQPLPPHLSATPGALDVQFQAAQPDTTTYINRFRASKSYASGSKAPYGSGDSEDGYTLVFPNLDAFNEWRQKEEETQMVEFVKGDTHGSKADPPRFKDHTKLLCARHSRSGRKKYVKKHPERVRKVPSRKLEGQGCPASISYKTYFDTDEVRASYNSQHSHEIGLANLPFTRRGRKAAADREKDDRERARQSMRVDGESDSTTSPPDSATVTAPTPQPALTPPSATTSSPSSSTTPFSSAISMIAPLPVQPHTYQPATHPYYPGQSIYQMPPPPSFAGHDRWENMATLFQSVREHARSFEYPMPSVAALESCLIRLYLESPMMAPPPPHPPVAQHPPAQSGPRVEPNATDSSSSDDDS